MSVGFDPAHVIEPFQTRQMLGDLVDVDLVYGLPHDICAFGEQRILLGSLLKRRVHVIGGLVAQSFHEYVEDVAVLLRVVVAVSHLARAVVHDAERAVAVFEQLFGIVHEHTYGSEGLARPVLRVVNLVELLEMRTGLNLLYRWLLRFAKRVLFEPHASLLGSPVLLHLVDGPEYHLGRHRRDPCAWCYDSSAVVRTAFCGVGSFCSHWGGIATC